jgi:hypothetical protein
MNKPKDFVPFITYGISVTTLWNIYYPKNRQGRTKTNKEKIEAHDIKLYLPISVITT